MNYSIILAAGKGTRSGYEKHKALLLYKKIPIYEYSLNTFFNNKSVNKIILVVPPQKEFKINKKFNKKVLVCIGDENNRQQSLINGMNLLKQVCNLQPDDVIITHDAARPFVRNDLIKKHISNTKTYGYTTTLYPINDSICEIKNNKIVYMNRDNKFVIQTPQSLLFKNWITKEIKQRDTDLFSYLGVSLNKNHIVEGNWKNLKLTTQSDFETLNNHD